MGIHSLSKQPPSTFFPLPCRTAQLDTAAGVCRQQVHLGSLTMGGYVAWQPASSQLGRSLLIVSSSMFPWVTHRRMSPPAGLRASTAQGLSIVCSKRAAQQVYVRVRLARETHVAVGWGRQQSPGALLECWGCQLVAGSLIWTDRLGCHQCGRPTSRAVPQSCC